MNSLLSTNGKRPRDKKRPLGMGRLAAERLAIEALEQRALLSAGAMQAANAAAMTAPAATGIPFHYLQACKKATRSASC